MDLRGAVDFRPLGALNFDPRISNRAAVLTPPRQIYASSLSRRDRAWGRPRRRVAGFVPLLWRVAVATCVALAMLALLPHPSG